MSFVNSVKPINKQKLEFAPARNLENAKTIKTKQTPNNQEKKKQKPKNVPKVEEVKMKKFAHRTDDHASTPRLMSRPKCSFMPYVLLHCERYRIHYNYESLRIYFCALLYDSRQVCLHSSDKLGLTIESHGSGNYRFHTSDT